jgi:hypothetical protein
MARWLADIEGVTSAGTALTKQFPTTAMSLAGHQQHQNLYELSKG